MELNDMFQSDKLVQPVWFSTENQSTDLYANAGRARQVAEDQSTWKVGGSSQPKYDWVVEYGKVSPADYEDRKMKEQSNHNNNESENNQSGDGKTLSRWVNIYKDKRDQWVKDIVKAYKEIGLSDNAIVNLLTKNAFESGWGQHAQGHFNFGNITAGSKWSGNIVLGNDTDAKGNPIKQRWRAYDSMKHYVQDELQFLENLYNFNPNDDFETFLSKLQDGKRKYAEALDYKDKLRSVKSGAIKRMKLYA